MQNSIQLQCGSKIKKYDRSRKNPSITELTSNEIINISGGSLAAYALAAALLAPPIASSVGIQYVAYGAALTTADALANLIYDYDFSSENNSDAWNKFKKALFVKPLSVEIFANAALIINKIFRIQPCNRIIYHN